MNPSMMKQAADGIANMSDDQIRSYLTSMGMGHISPQMFRSMSGNIKNMPDQDLERMKNQADPSRVPFFNNANNTSNSGSTNTSQNTTRNNSNINTHTTQSNTTQKNKTDTSSNNFYHKQTVVEKLENIKKAGNDCFRQNKYKEACEKYYEALNELEYIPDSEKINFKKELEDLEVVCRLNIANSKLKMEDYDLVIHECLKVLKKSENFKAHYRAGVAYYKKGNYTKAYHHLNKAKEVNKNEEAQQVDKYLTECKKFIDDMNKENMSKENNTNTTKESSNIRKEEPVKNNNATQEESNEEIRFKPKNKEPSKQGDTIVDNRKEDNVQSTTSTNKDQTVNKSKFKDVLEKEFKDEPSKREEPVKKDDEIVIEEESKTNNYNNYNGYEDNSYQNTNNYNQNQSGPTINKEMINQAKSKIESMKDDELDYMSNMIKNMDSEALRSMMKMQGMNLTDDQINLLKNNVNSDMFKTMAKNSHMYENMPRFNSNMNMNMNASLNNTNVSAGVNTNTHSSNEQTMTATANTNMPMPNMANMPNFADLKNMDMGSMMKFVQSNPQLLNMMGPQFSKMFGQNGGDPNMMMKSMESVLWLISFPQRIKSFFSSTQGKFFILFVIVLIIAYFYR